MSNESDDLSSDIIKSLQILVVIGGLAVIFGWYWKLCVKLTPGNKNIAITALIAISLIITIYCGFVILSSPASHPSSYYKPAQWRLLVTRKCIKELHTNGVQMNVACVGLDAPDIPLEIQNQYINRQFASDTYDLYFMSDTRINIERYHSNDPAWFIHPEMLWSDGTKPGVSLLRFWDWSMV